MRKRALAAVALLPLVTATAGSGQARQPAAARRPVPPAELVLQSAQQSPAKVVFSPDRSTVIGTNGVRIHLWDLPTGAIRRTLIGPPGELRAVALAPDGRTLASAHGSRVLLWDPATGKVRTEWETAGADVTALAFSTDGTRLVTGNVEGAVHLWEARTGKRLGELAGRRGSTRVLAFSPDGGQLAIGSLESPSRTIGVQVWNPAQGTLLWEALPNSPGLDLSFSSDGKQLAVATRSTVVFESKTGRILAQPRTDGYSESVAFHPAGKQLARGVHDRVELLDTQSWEVTATGPEGSPYTVRWSPDGKRLASVGLHRLIRLRSPDTCQVTTVLGEARPGPRIVASPDGRLLSFMAGTKLTVFDCLENSVKAALANDPVAQPEGFQPGSHTLIGVVRHLTADPRGDFLRLWDLDQGTPRGELPPPGKPRGTYDSTRDFAASPDGRLIATRADSGPFYLWDARTLKLLRTFAGPKSNVFSPTFCGNRHLAAVNTDARGISLWDVETGELLWSKTGFTGQARQLAVSPAGDLLAVSVTPPGPFYQRKTDTVQLYRLPEGTLAGTLPAAGPSLRVLEFSRSGAMLAVGDSLGRIRLWDVTKQALIREIAGQGEAVQDLTFTSAGDLLSTTSDATARLWNPGTGKWRLTWIFDLAPGANSQLTGWLIITPEGHYDAHGSADRLIRWRQGRNLFPAARFEREYRKPERIRTLLASAWQ